MHIQSDGRSVSGTRRFISRVRRADEKPTLHFITLLMSVLVAGSLGWAGSPLWIWLGGAFLLTTGHAYSWLTRSTGASWRSVFVVLALLATLGLVPRTVSQALAGDWLAVAHFLMLFQAVTSFEMRTRAGLFASIILSGTIFFFVGLQVVDITFGVFLTGFTTLLLSFLALSFLMDQAKDAEVRWFQGKYAFALFWTGVFLASMVMSSAIFLVLPKRLADPVENPSAAILPMRASTSVEVPEVTLEGPQALPVTSGAAPGRDGTESASATQTDSGEDALQVSSGGIAPGSADGADDKATGRFDLPGRGVGGLILGPGGGSLEAVGDDGSLVMRVRSPVLTYWRDGVYDTFDGEYWHRDQAAWVRRSETAERTVFAAPQPFGTESGPRYNQTFHILKPLGPGLVAGGYSPLFASFSSDQAPSTAGAGQGLEAGTAYRVVSTIPDFSAESLESALTGSTLEHRYHDVPDSVEGINGIANQITAGAYTDVERALLVVTYLDSNYEFDGAAADPLLPSANTVDFLTSLEPGTSMDFAAASVLLARGAGIPARLVTGYLPGGFDPLSGTYVVRDSDRHAWAEMYFSGLGWVPFDAAPAPAAATFGEGGSYYARVNSAFEESYGDAFFDAMRSAPEVLSSLSFGELTTEARGIAGPVAAGIALALIAFFGWKLWPRGSGRRVQVYARLAGRDRQELLRIYFKVERLLARIGVGLRGPAQTLGEFASQVEDKLGDAVRDLAYLRQMAWAAAYDPGPYEGVSLEEARTRARRIRAAVTESRRGRVFRLKLRRPRRRQRSAEERWPK